MRAIALVTVLAFLSTVFAGCADSNATANKASVSTTADAPTVSADTGSIAGIVVSDEQQPIAGAEVGMIDGPGLTTLSDNEGKFTFNELAPGAYKIVAQKLGFTAPSAKTVTVVAGEVASLNLQLVAIDVSKDPYTLHEELVGFFNAGLCAAGLTLRPGYLGATDNERSIFQTKVSDHANLKTTIDTLVWDQTAPGAATLFYLDHNIDGNAKAANMSGSPVVTRIDEPEDLKKKSVINHWTWLGCTGADTPTTVVTATLQQKFMIYLDHFYHELAPEDFSGVPG